MSNLQPSWDAVGGGGVYSAYYGPNNLDANGYYLAVSPGATAVYDGREAAPIYAGLTIDPTHGDYEDQGLFGFKPGDVPVSTFASQPLTYDFVNQYGIAPVWVYIELNKGVDGDVMYQYVPTSNPAWHTEDAGTGTHWRNGQTLSVVLLRVRWFRFADIATDNPGKNCNLMLYY